MYTLSPILNNIYINANINYAYDYDTVSMVATGTSTSTTPTFNFSELTYETGYSDVQEGDVVIIYVGNYNDATATTPDEYTLKYNLRGADSIVNRSHIFFKAMDSSPDTSVTITTNASRSLVKVFIVRGADTVAPIGLGSSTSTYNNSGQINPPAATPRSQTKTIGIYGGTTARSGYTSSITKTPGANWENGEAQYSGGTFDRLAGATGWGTPIDPDPTSGGSYQEMACSTFNLMIDPPAYESVVPVTYSRPTVFGYKQGSANQGTVEVNLYDGTFYWGEGHNMTRAGDILVLMLSSGKRSTGVPTQPTLITPGFTLAETVGTSDSGSTRNDIYYRVMQDGDPDLNIQRIQYTATSEFNDYTLAIVRGADPDNPIIATNTYAQNNVQKLDPPSITGEANSLSFFMATSCVNGVYSWASGVGSNWGSNYRARTGGWYNYCKIVHGWIDIEGSYDPNSGGAYGISVASNSGITIAIRSAP